MTKKKNRISNDQTKIEYFNVAYNPRQQKNSIITALMKESANIFIELTLVIIFTVASLCLWPVTDEKINEDISAVAIWQI